MKAIIIVVCLVLLGLLCVESLKVRAKQPGAALAPKSHLRRALLHHSEKKAGHKAKKDTWSGSEESRVAMERGN